MKLGLYLDMRNPPRWPTPWADLYHAPIDLVADAERRGAHAVWLTEHHGFADGYLSQPLALAAALAVRTRTLRIGTAVLLAPLRHPFFRLLWIANVLSNVGCWMQTTGAAWEMTSLTPDPIFVALLTSAGTLPMFEGVGRSAPRATHTSRAARSPGSRPPGRTRGAGWRCG